MLKRIFLNIVRLTNILGRVKGITVYFLLVLINLTRKMPFLYYWFLYKKHRLILGYLSQMNISEDMETPKKKRDDLPDNIIWIFWWQGYSQMPALVKACIKSVEKHAGPYTMILLSQDNIGEYLDLSCLSFPKREMSITSLSDYVRLSLLHFYGGGWIDATIFLSQDIPAFVYESSFFTVRHERKKFFCVSEFRWGISFLFCKKGNKLIDEVWRLFVNYWDKNTLNLDYFLMDYCFAQVTETDLSCKKIVEDVPFSNPMTYNGLVKKLNDVFNEREYVTITSDTWVHKLSYKIPLDTNTPLTFYHRLIGE